MTQIKPALNSRQHVKAIDILAAAIADGPCRWPKGLRHGHGFNDTGSGVPLNLLRNWTGHASVKDALGAAEQGIAARMG